MEGNERECTIRCPDNTLNQPTHSFAGVTWEMLAWVEESDLTEALKGTSLAVKAHVRKMHAQARLDAQTDVAEPAEAAAVQSGDREDDENADPARADAKEAGSAGGLV